MYLSFKHFMFVIAIVMTLDTVVFEIINIPSLSEEHGKKGLGFEKCCAQQNNSRSFSNIFKIKMTELSLSKAYLLTSLIEILKFLNCTYILFFV